MGGKRRDNFSASERGRTLLYVANEVTRLQVRSSGSPQTTLNSVFNGRH